MFQGVAVSKVQVQDNSVSALQLSDGRTITARHYIDASGNAAILRKALAVEVDEPPALRNIAIWDHWDDAEWAVSIGQGATRIQITSLGYGWIWFIPISPTRTSIGLVCPAEYYKKSGKRPEELYYEAVKQDARVASLIANATPTGDVKATKDWSFLSQRMAGDNWFLVGECAGFADPILSAGISMAMVGALECALTILELDRAEHAPEWLKTHFEKRQIQRVQQHIQFANFWYSANAHFSDLVEYTAEIAKEAGLNMDAKTAWQWLGTGGFVSLETAGAGLAGHSLEQIANLQIMMFAEESDWLITKSNVFDLDLKDAILEKIPVYSKGKIREGQVYRRDGKDLPISGGFRVALEILQKERRLSGVIAQLRAFSAKLGPFIALGGLEAIETMMREGWVKGSLEPGQRLLKSEDIPRTTNIDWNHDHTDEKVKIAEALGS